MAEEAQTKAEAFKSEGNAALQQGDHAKAVDKYTQVMNAGSTVGRLPAESIYTLLHHDHGYSSSVEPQATVFLRLARRPQLRSIAYHQLACRVCAACPNNTCCDHWLGPNWLTATNG